MRLLAQVLLWNLAVYSAALGAFLVYCWWVGRHDEDD